MSVMGFHKQHFDGGVGGWCELYPIFLGFLEFFNFAQPLSSHCLEWLSRVDSSDLLYLLILAESPMLCIDH